MSLPPKQQDHPPLRSAEELLQGLKRQLENVQEHFGRPTPTDTTPASLGRKSMNELQTSALVSGLDDESSSHNPDLPAVLDDDSIQRLWQLTNEHPVVAFLTPVFERILQCTSRESGRVPLASDYIRRLPIQSKARQYLLSRRNLQSSRILSPLKTLN